jgi:predicted ATP-dependent endonuclease of OLD family
MQLIAFSLEGYKRFVAKTSVKLHSDLVAFVGPNEAGKSSLLTALAHLNNKDPFEPTERPRRTTLEPKLTWHLQLEASDKAEIGHIYDTAHVERVVITKNPEGARTWRFEPRDPRRDLTSRQQAAALMTDLRGQAAFSQASWDEDQESNLDAYDSAIGALGSQDDVYPSDVVESFRNLAAWLRSLEFPAREPDDEDEDVHIERESSFDHLRSEIADMLDSVANEQDTPRPWRQLVDALVPRLPEIYTFTGEDRTLASQYDLAEIAENPPPALEHLASLAELDLKKLLEEATAGAFADVATRRNAANRVLLEAFNQSWNQQGIAIQLDIQGTILHVQATTPQDSGLSEIGERSDGLRWFAALLAFTHGWDERPILLVDEIETHLHYDAQADLIAVLAKQQFTSKVIYTTHSFGCLPYDLGAGVKVVHPIDSATSRLENGFWTHGAGFSPLLACMGAAAMSFTPTRRAVIGEGPADAILLPTLLRQASGRDRLDFQVAPGLAGVAAAAVSDLDVEAGRVGYIVDGDEGGLAISRKLIEAGIPAERVVILADEQDPSRAYETEDFIDIDVYLAAVNAELRCWNALVTQCQPADLGDTFRTKTLDSWCKSHGYDVPDKAAVAQRILDASFTDQIHAAQHETRLRDLLTHLDQILNSPTGSKLADETESRGRQEASQPHPEADA